MFPRLLFAVLSAVDALTIVKRTDWVRDRPPAAVIFTVYAPSGSWSFLI
jgi:hypothetical protein